MKNHLQIIIYYINQCKMDLINERENLNYSFVLSYQTSIDGIWQKLIMKIRCSYVI
jgi:hypothetical protein